MNYNEKNEEKVPINNEKIINKVEKLDQRMAYVTTQLELLLAKEIERNPLYTLFWGSVNYGIRSLKI